MVIAHLLNRQEKLYRPTTKTLYYSSAWFYYLANKQHITKFPTTLTSDNNDLTMRERLASHMRTVIQWASADVVCFTNLLTYKNVLEDVMPSQR